MPGEPPATGRVPGAEAVGGGSGWLCTLDERCCWTVPVTSCGCCAEACGLPPNGLESKRSVSELHPAAAAEIVANKARRNRRSERRGSATQRIGFPTRTQQTSGQ